MARYQQSFELDPVDIDLIESAIRRKIADHASTGLARGYEQSAQAEMDALNRVLGKIHNQKVFYAQVRAVGVPAA